MDNLAADFTINPNNPLNAEYELNNNHRFDCSFELFASGTVWGSISGNIENQTDLINLLNAKVDLTTFNDLSQTVTNNYNELSGDITNLTGTVIENYNTLNGQISNLSTTVNNNYTSLDNRLTVTEGSILDLTNTVSNNYTELNNKITTNTNNITSLTNTITNFGDIVSYNAADFATKNQGLLADTALQPNDNITLLNNNAGYITNAVNDLTNYYLKSETYTKTEVQQLIASIPKFTVTVVQELPVIGQPMTLYLVPKDGEAPDVYNEYIWVEDEEEFELLGSTAVDLDGYATEAWVQSQGYATIASLAAVATSGSYNDLLNKPTIPTDNAQLTNGAGYITGINQSDVINALGYTPYNSTNPNGYITSSALNGYATETYVSNGLATKQNTLTAGDNIIINGDTISAVDTTYTAGTGIEIVNGVISNTQTSAEWGNIEGDIADQTDLVELLDTKQDKLTSDNAGTDIEIVNGAGGDDTISGNGSILLEKAVANGLNSVTVSGGLKRSLLPDGYTQYDYITVNGDCYFVTDYYPSNLTEVKTKTFMHKQPTSPLVTRWTGSPTNDTFGFYMGNVSGRLTIFYGRYSDTKYLNIESTKLNIEHDIYIGVKSITFDGTSYSITRDTFTSTQPIYIGAFNQTGSSIAGMMYGRIYPIEFIEGGKTVKHYIPCKNNNGVIGLYEAITGTFINPTGTGTAKKGRPTINIDTIPDTYTRIDFLQATGTQYIDSGVIANFANNKIEQTATVQYTTSNTSRELMGTNGYGFWGKNASNKIEAALGQTTLTDNALVKNVINWTTDPDGNKLILNVNSNQYTSTASTFVDANYAYYVFALGIRVDSGAAASFLCHAKVWDYTMAVDNEVVCYLIPVKRNSDNVLGMYDVVTGTFKTNAGTGTFTAGSNVALPSPNNLLPIVSNNGELKARHSSGLPLGFTKVEYIQSTGTQYIDTGYFISDLTNKYSVHLRMTVDGGTAQGTSSNNWGYMGINGGLILTYTPNGLGLANEGVPVTENKIFDVTMTRNSNASRVLIIDDTTINMTNQGTSVPDRPFGIFRLSPFSTEFNRIYGKIYEFQGYVNDILVKNLIPCRRNSDSVLGMYDTISGTFLTNAGTGTFTAGNNVTDNVIVYTDGITETITDSANNTATAEMLLSIGNYTDTQEILTGAVTRKVGVIVLNGTENWGVYATNNGYRSFRVNNFLDAGTRDGVCTHLPYYNFSSSAMDRECVAIGGNKTSLYINLAGEERTADNMKAWLASQYNAGTPVIIVYPLATETTETVTGQTLTTIQGDSTLTISQASVENLPIEANYNVQGGTVINFVNDSGFITNTVNNLTNYYLKTETYTKLEVQQLIASIPQFSVEVVQSLPVTGERMVLYLVPKVGQSPDVYEEYIWVEDDSQFELIGSTAIDLSDYITNEDLSTALSDYVTNNDLATALASYVTNSDLNTTLADYTPTTDLATVATTGDYDDLTNKPTIPTVNNGTLTISRNHLPVGTFTANSSVNQTINISVPTTTSQIQNDTKLVSYQVNGTEELKPIGFTGDGETFTVLYVGNGFSVGDKIYDLVYDGTYSYYGAVVSVDPSVDYSGLLNVTLDTGMYLDNVLESYETFQSNTKYFAWYDHSNFRTIYTEVIQGTSDVYTLEDDEFVLELSNADVLLSMSISGSITCTINQYDPDGFTCTPSFELNVLDYSDTTVDLLNANSEVISTIPSNIVTSVNNIQPVDGNVTITIPDTSSLADDTLSNVTSIDSNSAVQTALNGKQNTISDLATIRNGASAGATAVQPSTLTSYVAKSEVTYDSTTSTLYIGVSQP